MSPINPISPMQDILQDIIAHKHQELERMYAKKPSMKEALLDSGTGIIAEFKRRSPSKGWIKEDGRADIIPLSYQQNGAAALSILTDKDYFGGHDDFIRTARQSGVNIPILYKNFVIDEMQLYEAALCGASAVLLIAACLTEESPPAGPGGTAGNAQRGRTGICGTRPRHVRHQQPQPRFVRHGCRKLIPSGRAFA